MALEIQQIVCCPCCFMIAEASADRLAGRVLHRFHYLAMRYTCHDPSKVYAVMDGQVVEWTGETE